MADQDERLEPGGDDSPETPETDAEAAFDAEVAALEAEDAPDAPDEAASEDDGEDDAERGADRVPRARLKAEAEKRRAIEAERDQMRERLARLDERQRMLAEQREAEKVGQPPADPFADLPDWDEDPLGRMRAVEDLLRQQVSSRQQETAQQAEQRRQAEAQQAMVQDYRTQAATFAEKTPDFMDAYQFYKQSRYKELSRVTANVDQAFIREELALADQARRRGANAGEWLYEMAKDRGYAPAEAEDKPDDFEKTKRAAQAARTVGGGGGGASGTPSAKRLMDMNDADFAKAVASGAFDKAMGG